MESIKGAWQNLESGRFNEAVQGLDPRQEPSAFSFLDLSYKTRLYAFFGCMGVGFGLGILGAVFFVLGDLTLFALLYVIGLLVSLTGTGFLVGFGRQIKQMFDTVRLIATVLLLGCILMTFISAFALHITGLVFLFAICSWLAYAWYSLSYLPFARAAVKNAASRVVG